SGVDLHSSVASVCRETDRDSPERIPGPDIILDRRRSGAEAPSLSAVFQSTTGSLGLGRKAARSRGCADAIKLGFVLLSATLSRPLSDSDRRLIVEFAYDRLSCGYLVPLSPQPEYIAPGARTVYASVQWLEESPNRNWKICRKVDGDSHVLLIKRRKLWGN